MEQLDDKGKKGLRSVEINETRKKLFGYMGEIKEVLDETIEELDFYIQMLKYDRRRLQLMGEISKIESSTKKESDYVTFTKKDFFEIQNRIESTKKIIDGLKEEKESLISFNARFELQIKKLQELENDFKSMLLKIDASKFN